MVSFGFKRGPHGVIPIPVRAVSRQSCGDGENRLRFP